ncbi:ABC transporter substrate-binding protein [Paenibacillus spongiae]|uniref:ABC transporter substrate-binding protein n=1 Tax=Paenibacillus spongiae TaxID=2909671 RepID=A0ABY5S9D6_9BACL|nr:ABC transporter substrate-binding protein [Paenibacillus spongiae]UVI29145.1 ABC transporter substrate-binding protein [Paenibacillus spongiae]
MRITRNSRLLMTAIVLLTLGIAGCGSSQSVNRSDSDAVSVVQKKYKITFWKWIPSPDQMPKLERAFEQLNPDIDLVVKHIGESGAFFQKLAVGLASGNGPDVIAMQVGANANQFKSYLEPLRPYAERTWGTEWRSKFLDIALKQAAFSGEDYYVLPGGMTVAPIILYNDKLFQKHGLQPPTTYDDLTHIVAVLSKAEPGMFRGIGIGAKEGWACRDVFMAIAGQVAPGSVYQAEQGLLPWTDPLLVESFRWWQRMFAEGIFSTDAFHHSVYPDAFRQFNSGKQAMVSLGSWQLSSMTRQSAGMLYDPPRFGMFPLPQLIEAGKRNVTATVDIAWGMNKDSRNKGAVWRFIQFMTVGEGQQMWTEMLQVLPSASEVRVDEEWMYGTVEKEALRMTLEYLNKGVSGPRELQESDVQQSLFLVLQALAFGSITPDEAAYQMQQSFEKG